MLFTAWKMSVLGVFMVRNFLYLVWIRRDTEYLSVISPDAGKYGPEKLRIQALFTHCLEHVITSSKNFLPKNEPEQCLSIMHSCVTEHNKKKIISSSNVTKLNVQVCSKVHISQYFKVLHFQYYFMVLGY